MKAVSFMRAYVLNGYGGPSQAVVTDMPVPAAGPDDVLISVKAAGLNPVDFKIREGKLRAVIRLRLPVVLGNECAGVVSAAGKNVSRFKVGDRVFFRSEKSRMGCFAETVAADQSVVAMMPKALDFARAAAVPLAGLTALQALRDHLAVKSGMRILITGGAGGVGLFAIQLAKLMGAHVITTASPRGAALVKASGADEVIDYTVGDFSAHLRQLDGVFDLIGGETLDKCFAITKKGGQVVSIAGTPEPLTARKDLGLGMVMQGLFWLFSFKVRGRASAAGVTYRSIFMHPSGDDLAYLSSVIDAGKLNVTLDRSMPFAKIGEAFAHLETGHAKGKVVVTF
jgi:NADPH:quinone reductase-like Zn-dependent oxidoreductase